MFIREYIPTGDFNRDYRYAMLDVMDESFPNCIAKTSDYRLMLLGA